MDEQDDMELRAKLSDTEHPVTRILTHIHEMREQKVFEVFEAKTHLGKCDDDTRFVRRLVRAFEASQTREHYAAFYSLWDDAPFRDVSRMVIKLIYNFIVTHYSETR